MTKSDKDLWEPQQNSKWYYALSDINHLFWTRVVRMIRAICFLVSTSLGPKWPTECDNRDFFNTFSVASFEFSSSLLWHITCHSGVWYMWLYIISTFCRSFYFFHVLSCIIISLPFSSCMKLRCTGKPLSSISPLMHYFPLASQKDWLLTIPFLDYSTC